MPQQEFVPKNYKRQPSQGPTLHLRSNEKSAPIEFTFEVLRPGLFRTTFSSETHPLPPFPSAQKPQAENANVTYTSDGYEDATFQSSNVTARVTWEDVPLLSIGFESENPLYEDLPFRSYALDGSGIAHYTRYARGALHFGLGEKAAPMDLSNRHFALSATDCFGYDVHRTDPMYKHIPLLVRAGPEGLVATFSTSHARGYYSVGSEMDVSPSTLCPFDPT